MTVISDWHQALSGINLTDTAVPGHAVAVIACLQTVDYVMWTSVMKPEYCTFSAVSDDFYYDVKINNVLCLFIRYLPVLCNGDISKAQLFIYLWWNRTRVHRKIQRKIKKTNKQRIGLLIYEHLITYSERATHPVYCWRFSCNFVRIRVKMR